MSSEDRLGIESRIHVLSQEQFLDKDLQAYASSPDFSFMVEKIRSFLELEDIQGVVDLIKLGVLKSSELRKIIAIHEVNPENHKFVTELKRVLQDQLVFEHFFNVEDEIMSVSAGADLHSLMLTGNTGLNEDTLRSLLKLYEDGRRDPGECREKIQNALNFGLLKN